jgi:rsbT antagonist protein RsbS
MQTHGTHTIPVIELWGQLLVPLQGEIGDAQMDALQSNVLDRIRTRGAEGLVIDASGVWLMDSHLCTVLARLASSARLMGARAVLCGLGPHVVMTLQAMGIDFEGVETALGLEAALDLLGVRPQGNDDDVEEGEEQ